MGNTNRVKKHIDMRTLSKIEYNSKQGYGCVEDIHLVKDRHVDIGKIKKVDSGFQLVAPSAELYKLKDAKGQSIKIQEAKDFDFGGMIFRIDLEPGIYDLQVRVSSSIHPIIGISGLNGLDIQKEGYWNDVEKLPKQSRGRWEKNTWSFRYVNHSKTIFIEVEGMQEDQEIIVEVIDISQVMEEPNERKNKEKGQDKPQLFLLGDSTVKSYLFQEAPMCGWGQVLDHYMDSDKIDIVNFSNGGRALKSMYVEGRLNDLLLKARPGDYFFLQSGHNDEKENEEGAMNEGPRSRFGRGSTGDDYERYLEEIFIPASKLRKLNLLLVTPMTRIPTDEDFEGSIENSFTKVDFPEIMRKVAQRHHILLLDLNKRSIDYVNKIGFKAVRPLYMAMEAGESPGRVGGYCLANGNQNHADGTHFKEALAEVYARLVTEEIGRLTKEEREQNKKSPNRDLLNFLESCRKSYAFKVPEDILKGENTAYRNQIEKMLKKGVMTLRKDLFCPTDVISIKEFMNCLNRLFIDAFDQAAIENYGDGQLRHLELAELLYDLLEKEALGKLWQENYVIETYRPLVEFEEVKDKEHIPREKQKRIQKVWEKGLFRSEAGIKRGQCFNGNLFEPMRLVTREKAAKYLYFLWVLSKPSQVENHL